MSLTSVSGRLSRLLRRSNSTEVQMLVDRSKVDCWEASAAERSVGSSKSSPTLHVRSDEQTASCSSRSVSESGLPRCRRRALGAQILERMWRRGRRPQVRQNSSSPCAAPAPDKRCALDPIAQTQGDIGCDRMETEERVDGQLNEQVNGDFGGTFGGTFGCLPESKPWTPSSRPPLPPSTMHQSNTLLPTPPSLNLHLDGNGNAPHTPIINSPTEFQCTGQMQPPFLITEDLSSPIVRTRSPSLASNPSHARSRSHTPRTLGCRTPPYFSGRTQSRPHSGHREQHSPDPWVDHLFLPGVVQSLPSLPFMVDEEHTPGPVDLFVLHASPLGPNLPRQINVQAELELLTSVLEESQAGWRVHVSVARADTFLQLLTRARAGGRFLIYISAHCDNNPEHGVGLVLEDGYGGPHVLYRDQLRDLLQSHGGLDKLPSLFVNACWSDAIADLFADCGCRHIVATSGQVLDSAAQQFAQQFYFSLGSRESLGKAFESARQGLRIDPRPDIRAHADRFIVRGASTQEDSHSSFSVQDLCSQTGASGSPLLPPWKPGPGWEEFGAPEIPDLPPRVEDFVGRGWALRQILRVYSSSGHGPGGARRACIVHGQGGMGKTAAIVELAHFASTPGRLFSRGVVYVKLQVREFGMAVDAITESLEAILALTFGNASSSSVERGYRSPPPGRVGTPGSCESSERRLHWVGQQLEDSTRRRRRFLLVIDDEAGFLHSSADMRRAIGGLLQATRRLCVLCASRKPIYQSLGSHMCENYNLGPLTGVEAARLFLRRRHRPLHPRDLTRSDNSSGASVEDAFVMPQGFEQLVQTMAVHPLLKSLEGHPGRLRAASSRVTPALHSLFDLCPASS